MMTIRDARWLICGFVCGYPLALVVEGMPVNPLSALIFAGVAIAMTACAITERWLKR